MGPKLGVQAGEQAREACQRVCGALGAGTRWAGSCRPCGVPAASPGAPDGSRPEAHTLLHLVPSRLPVRLHGPESPEPGQQALLPPLCGQPAWRGTRGPGQGAQHSEGGVLCISVGSRDRGPGRLSHAGPRPSRHAPLATPAPAVALPSEDALKASQWPQRSPSLEVGTRLCP